LGERDVNRAGNRNIAINRARMRKKTHISPPTFSKKKKGGVARRAIAMSGRGGLFCKSKNTILKYVDNFMKKTTPSLRATPPIHFMAGGEIRRTAEVRIRKN
jgi:hypothetical protein